MEVYYEDELLEKSSGTFTIENDKLIYRRKSIESLNKNVKIPIESIFVIKETQLILVINNYLFKY